MSKVYESPYRKRFDSSLISVEEIEGMRQAALRFYEKTLKHRTPYKLTGISTEYKGYTFYNRENEDLHTWSYGYLTWVECVPEDASAMGEWQGRIFPITGAFPHEMDERIPYRCTGCGAQGRKLWRQYQTFADESKLLCARCAVTDQKLEGEEARVDQDGYRLSPHVGRCDQIGWLVPAVPTDDGESFWGYTSVPENRVAWWRSLPT